MLRSHFVWLIENEEFAAIPEGRVLHHIDHDCQNDDPINLVLMTYEEHDQYHKSDEGLQVTKKKLKKFTKHKPESIALLTQIAKARGNNNVWGGKKTKHFDATLEKMRAKAAAENNSMYRKDLNSDAIVKAFRELGNLAEVARIFDCSVSAVRSRISFYSKNDSWLSLSDEEIINELVKHNNVLTACARSLGAPLTSFSRRVKKIKENNGIR